MFRDRTDAAFQLAERLKGRAFRRPLVPAIPRGGVVTGAILARELGADLDVVLSRKLRAPDQPELASALYRRPEQPTAILAPTKCRA